MGAVIKKSIDFSKDTYSAAYNKFSQFVSENQILEAIRAYVEKYNSEKNYAMVIATQSVSGAPGALTAPVVDADSALDVTDEILAGLNDEYIKSKSAPKAAPAE